MLFGDRKGIDIGPKHYGLVWAFCGALDLCIDTGFGNSLGLQPDILELSFNTICGKKFLAGGLRVLMEITTERDQIIPVSLDFFSDDGFNSFCHCLSSVLACQFFELVDACCLLGIE